MTGITRCALRQKVCLAFNVLSKARHLDRSQRKTLEIKDPLRDVVRPVKKEAVVQYRER